MLKTAELSPCDKYRWWLGRKWNETKPEVCWVMLNPSTADATEDDATIRKLIGFAKLWGAGSIIVRNLFPFRSRYPNALHALEKNYRSGGYRGDAELMAAAIHPMLFVGWGANETYGRVGEFLQIIKRTRPDYLDPPKCLSTLNNGSPGHPLFIPYATPPQVWRDFPPTEESNGQEAEAGGEAPIEVRVGG